MPDSGCLLSGETVPGSGPFVVLLSVSTVYARVETVCVKVLDLAE